MQSLLAQLRTARTQHVEAIARLDGAILALKRAEGVLSPDERAIAYPGHRHDATSFTKPTPKAKKLARARYVKAIAKVLQKNDPHGLSVRQIVKRLQESGVRIKSNDTYHAVYKALKRNPGFRRSDGGVWALAVTHADTSGMETNLIS